jgi:hypothetical protein
MRASKYNVGHLIATHEADVVAWEGKASKASLVQPHVPSDHHAVARLGLLQAA